MKKKLFIAHIVILVFYPIMFIVAGVGEVTPGVSSSSPKGRLYNIRSSTGYAPVGTDPSKSIALYVGKIIQYLLSFLGVIFLVLLIYAGFLWLTASGDSDMVTKSKEIMTNAVIGIIIVLMSYAITFYVVEKLSSTTISS